MQHRPADLHTSLLTNLEPLLVLCSWPGKSVPAQLACSPREPCTPGKSAGAARLCRLENCLQLFSSAGLSYDGSCVTFKLRRRCRCTCSLREWHCGHDCPAWPCRPSSRSSSSAVHAAHSFSSVTCGTQAHLSLQPSGVTLRGPSPQQMQHGPAGLQPVLQQPLGALFASATAPAGHSRGSTPMTLASSLQAASTQPQNYAPMARSPSCCIRPVRPQQNDLLCQLQCQGGVVWFRKLQAQGCLAAEGVIAAVSAPIG